MQQTSKWTDRRVGDIIGNLLRAGVLLSAVVVLAGSVVYFARHGLSPADYGVFRGEPTDLRHVSGIIRGALAREGRGIIQLGVLLLIATPVARVAFSIFGFAAEKDHMYVAIASFVLLVLLYSLIGSS